MTGEKEGIHFVCRIRENTRKEVVRLNAIPSDSIVFYDAVAYLGTKGINKTEKGVRVVGYRVDGKEYWVATDRYDLTGEQIAIIYKLRWNIEIFFGWWKRHLISVSPYGTKSVWSSCSVIGRAYYLSSSCYILPSCLRLPVPLQTGATHRQK